MSSATVESPAKLRRPSSGPLQMTTPIAQISAEDIARRAYELYLQRGAAHGNDLEDWLMAESELLQRNAALTEA
jgi:Protein of unknown function (DUF2934)